MTKKLFFALVLAAGLFTAPSFSLMASSNTIAFAQSEDIPFAVQEAIFTELSSNNVCTFDQAAFWYGNGEMTITKVSSFTYQVFLPGGLETILIVDSL